METAYETDRMGLVPRTVAFGLALATTCFIATSVAVVFTGSTHTVGSALAHFALAHFALAHFALAHFALAHFALAPFRAALGG